MARQCIFCGSIAKTREHLWPEWVHKLLNLTGSMSHSIGKSTPKIIGDTEIKVKKVCKSCNEGWMSKLENKNKAIMEPMIVNTPLAIPLDPAQKTSISEWAIKTAMVLDSVYSKRKLFYSQSERDAMRTSLSLPSHVFIWLGQIGVKGLTADGTDMGIFGTDEIVKVADGNVCTFVLGSLIIQVLAIHWIGGNGHGHPATKSGPWDTHLVPIYPLTLDYAAWPPYGSFDVPTFRILHDRWRVGKVAL